MTDFMDCPTCHGRGVVQMETGERLAAHNEGSHREATTRQTAQQAELYARHLADMREDFDRRDQERRERERRQLGAADSGTKSSPEQVAELKARLKRLDEA